MGNRPNRAGNRKWSTAQLADAKKLYLDGYTYAEIAAQLGRTMCSVSSMMHRQEIAMPEARAAHMRRRGERWGIDERTEKA